MNEIDAAATAPAAGRASRGRLVAEATLIVALTLTLNLTGNGQVGLWDRDEPRYATCTREMRDRGDWIHPTFNGQPRYHKPVLIYWLMRAGLAIGGDNPFGARLVSGFAGMTTCLLVWRLGRLIGGPTVGLLAGITLATAPIMIAESKLATTDATLACLVVAAQVAVWNLGWRDRVGDLVGFWAAIGAMTLLKGPVGPLLVGVAGLLSWWWGGPAVAWRRIGQRWRIGLAIFAGLTVPWYLAIAISSRGEFFRFAVHTQVVQRIATGLENHGGFPGYYAVLSLGVFYPWSALVPAALVMAWTRRKANPAAGFLLGWIIGPMLVLECVSTKLIHYYLPSYPACALLVAWWVAEAARLGLALGRWPLGRLAIKLVGAIAIGGVVGLLAGTIALPPALRGPCLAMALVLGVGSALGRVWLARGATYRGIGALATTWAGVMGLLVGWTLPSAEPFRLSRLVGEELDATSARLQVRPAIMTYQEPGVIYALGRLATDVRSPDDLAAEVRARGPVLLPLMPEEVDPIRADARFRCEPAGAVLGYNANKGKQQVLHLVVIRLEDSTPDRTVARSGGQQQPFVE